MEIYFEMLTFTLSENIMYEHTGTAKAALEVIHAGLPDEDYQENTLYIFKVSEIDIIEMSFKRQTAADRSCVNLFLMSESGIDAPKAEEMTFLRKEDNFALLHAKRKDSELINMVYEAYFGLLKWEASLSDAFFYAEDTEALLGKAKKYFSWQYFIFNRNLSASYNSDESIISSENFSRMLSDNVFQELISDKAFHDAKYEKDIFYYIGEDGGTSLCKNLTLNGEYMARLLMIIGPGDIKIHPGAEEIFRIFSEYVQKCLDYGKIQLGSNLMNRIHEILKNLGKGISVSEAEISSALDAYMTQKDFFMLAVVFRFYSDPDWPSQLEITLPYMATQLEREFPFSAAAATDTEIIMYIHIENTKDAEQKFFGSLAGFVRENICSAGVSSKFYKTSQLKDAILSARAALRIGSRIKPQMWYYVFDDWRLEYILEQSRTEISSDLICHPAVNILEKYDAENKTELCRSLYIYLKHNLNMTQAAKEVFIHRTSFFYRIEHVKELTGIDLNDPETVLSLLVSYNIKDRIR